MKRALARYTAHPDPLVAAGNTLALIVASNQPTYPLYVWLATGGGAWPAAIVLLAVPAFCAIPWVARRSSLAGRAMLPLVGIANILLAVWTLGSEAGLDALLIPCAGIAAALLRARERLVMLALVAIAIGAWLLAADHPRHLFADDGYASLRRLNAISALALCGLVGMARAQAGRLRRPRAVRPL